MGSYSSYKIQSWSLGICHSKEQPNPKIIKISCHGIKGVFILEIKYT